MTKRCLIMAGGTGGHVFPGLAVAHSLIELGWQVEWLGTESRMEAEIVPKAGIPIHFIQVSGLRGKGVIGKLSAVYHVLLSTTQTMKILRRFNPDVVIGMGGYASGPGGVAAWLLRKPLLLHEQNAVAGLTNRLLSRLATCVFVGFEEAKKQLGQFCKQTVVSGNPVRQQVLQITPHASCSTPLNLLVLGGSLGARPLNEIVPAIAGKYEQLSIRHQCGKGNVDAVQHAYAEAHGQVEVCEFIDDMAEAYEWADCIVCRAGALTVAEVAASGRAAIFVPLPHAVDDHQTQNARSLVDKHAGVLIAQHELNDKLADVLESWIKQPELCAKTGHIAKQYMHNNATKIIVDQCQTLAGDGA